MTPTPQPSPDALPALPDFAPVFKLLFGAKMDGTTRVNVYNALHDMLHAYGRQCIEASRAVRAEPVYLVATGDVSESGHALYERHEGKPPPMCDFEGPLYAANQPQAAESVPADATEAQLRAALRAAREVIALERQSFADCNNVPGLTEGDDPDNFVRIGGALFERNDAEVVADYDRVLKQIDEAIAQHKEEGARNG